MSNAIPIQSNYWGTAGDVTANLLYAAAFLGFFSFMGLYAARSNWRATAPGRALMYAVGSLNIVVLQSTVHQFTGRYEFIWITRNVTGALVFLAAWRLVWVLSKIQGPIDWSTFFVPREFRGRTDIIRDSIEKDIHMDEKVIVPATVSTPANLGVPTQIANPKKAGWRTFLQALLGGLASFNAIAGILAAALAGDDKFAHLLGHYYGPIVAVVSGIIVVGSFAAKLLAQIMANPIVNAWIIKYLPAFAPQKVIK